MGQYFIIANLDKMEYIHPHDLKCGAKLLEICNEKLIGGMLLFLLKQSKNFKYLNIGRWAEDKIIVIGDYDNKDRFWHITNKFTNISRDIINEYRLFLREN